MANPDETTDPELDPELGAILAERLARMAARSAMETVSLAEMRARAAAEFEPWNLPRDVSVEARDLVAEGDRRVALRLYRPAFADGDGLLVWLHGGGWVVGDLDLEDEALRRLARASGVRILAVDYRLAPEHPFPAAIEDAGFVRRWVDGTPPELGFAPRRVALGGASAGANLALATALRLRDEGDAGLAFLLLMYGAYAGGKETGSARRFGDGRYGLTAAAMDYFWHAYAGSDATLADPLVAPLAADLAGLPPIFLNHAGLDILRDDTILLAERLSRAGVSIEHRGYPGAIHGFTQYAKGSAVARQALDEAGAALKAALG